MSQSTLNQDAARFEPRQPRGGGPDTSVVGRVGSALALILLLLGLPVSLILLGGVPSIPTSMPDLSMAARQLSPSDLVVILVGIVWLVWLVFVVSFVVELLAARRGGMAKALPFAGPIQGLARMLVGGLLVTGIVVGGASAAGAAPSHSRVAAPQAAAMNMSVMVDDVTSAAHEAAADQVSVDPRLEDQLVYTVQAPVNGYHDNLWDIAERHLGSGSRYREIYELNKDQLQPDGRKLELARLIQPGWQLVMPADAVGVERVNLQADNAADGVGEEAAPTSKIEHGASAEQSTTKSAPEVSTIADVDGSRFDNAWWIGAGMAAAGVLGSLAYARRRGPGRRPDDAARRLEDELRMAADPERARTFDLVLRHLSFSCEQSQRTIPLAYAAIVGDNEIELLLAPARAEAVPGWEAVDGGRSWRFSADFTALHSATSAPCAYPAMVSLGVDDKGRDVMVDLEAAGGLVTVDGDLGIAGEIVASLAIQSASSSWSADRVRVLATGLPGGIESVGDRLWVFDGVEAVLDEIRQDGRDSGVLTGRRRPDKSTLVALGELPTSDMMRKIAQSIGGGRSGTAVVAVGDHPTAKWRIRVDDQGAVFLPQLDISVTANRVGVAQVEAIRELFDAARDSSADTEGSRVPVPAAPRNVDDSAWVLSGCRVSILGDAEVVGQHEVREGRLHQLTEMVVYLACHPSPVHPTVLGSAVWPLGITGDVLQTNISRARDWLGTGTDGSHLLGADDQGRLFLSPEVVVDWDVFCTLAQAARSAAYADREIDLLWRALKLVRGPAFGSPTGGRYSWISAADIPRSITVLILDSVMRLIELLDGEGDPASAAAAAELGLRVAPSDQRLWQIAIRQSHAAEGSAGVAGVVQRMYATVDAAGIDHATAELIAELLPSGGMEAS